MGFKGFPQDEYDFYSAEVGAALSWLVVREPSGLPRVGVLGRGPKIAAVAAAWKVEASAFVHAHTVNGVTQWSGESDVVQSDIAPATGIPAGQARIDVLAWDPVEAEFTVVQGTVAVSPVVPPIGGLAGYAEIRVNAGDGMVVPGQVKPIFQYADRVHAEVSSPGPGFAVGLNTRVECDASGWVDIQIEAVKSGSRIQSADLVVVIPAGFRPVGDVEVSGTVSNGGVGSPVFVQVAASGEARVWNPAPLNTKCVFNARYRAA